MCLQVINSRITQKKDEKGLKICVRGLVKNADSNELYADIRGPVWPSWNSIIFKNITQETLASTPPAGQHQLGSMHDVSQEVSRKITVQLQKWSNMCT